MFQDADDAFLANMNSSSSSLYVVVRPSVVCLSSVCYNNSSSYPKILDSFAQNLFFFFTPKSAIIQSLFKYHLAAFRNRFFADSRTDRL